MQTVNKKRTWQVVAALLVLAGLAVTVPAAPPQKMVTVPAGTSILIRTVDPIDSSKMKPGAIFTAVLETNVQVGSTIVAPAGTKVHGRLPEAKQAGRLAGKSELQLELKDIIIGGTAYPVLSSNYKVQGKSSGAKTAKRTLGGAGLGAMIGGIAGNAGMGAAIGATAGLVASGTKGQAAVIPPETLLEFRLEQPASLPAPR